MDTGVMRTFRVVFANSKYTVDTFAINESVVREDMAKWYPQFRILNIRLLETGNDRNHR